jgi:hypothetical protein
LPADVKESWLPLISRAYEAAVMQAHFIHDQRGKLNSSPSNGRDGCGDDAWFLGCLSRLNAAVRIGALAFKFVASIQSCLSGLAVIYDREKATHSDCR